MPIGNHESAGDSKGVKIVEERWISCGGTFSAVYKKIDMSLEVTNG